MVQVWELYTVGVSEIPVPEFPQPVLNGRQQGQEGRDPRLHGFVRRSLLQGAMAGWLAGSLTLWNPANLWGSHGSPYSDLFESTENEHSCIKANVSLNVGSAVLIFRHVHRAATLKWKPIKLRGQWADAVVMVSFTLLLSTSLCLNQAPPLAFVSIISAQREIRTFAVHKSASLRFRAGPSLPRFCTKWQL